MPEIWFERRTQIERGQIILPNDRELIGQLTSRSSSPDSKGRLVLESKADMRSRGLSSPDRADAILGAVARNVVAADYGRIEMRRGGPDKLAARMAMTLPKHRVLI